MADPRDTARQWLGERLALAYNVCTHDRGGYSPCDGCRVEAILSAPGVEIDQVKAVGAKGRVVELHPRSPWATHTQVVIRLPAQPIEKAPG